MQKDVHLKRWSNLLAVVAILAAVVVLFRLADAVSFDGTIRFIKENGAQKWDIKLSDIPLFERLTVVALRSVPPLGTLYTFLQVFLLARNYRSGQIFSAANARYFVRIGLALLVMAAIGTVTFPFLNHFLYWRGISPWLADLPPLQWMLRPGNVLVGLFCLILGKIMQRASELEENDRMMI